MGGKFGVDEISKILVAAIDCANVIDAIAHGGNKLGFFALAPDALTLATLDAAKLKLEVTELDAEDRQTLLNTLKAKLALTNQKLTAKIDAGFDVVNEAVYIATDVVTLVQRAKALIAA